jgi:predicted lipoprotein
MWKPCAIALCLMANSALADQKLVNSALDYHILPAFETLATETVTLAETTAAHCSPDSPELRAAYGRAFDAWVNVSHLRFGPSEEEDRAFALAFWPDTKGFTPKALNRLIAAKDPIVFDPVDFATLSVAGRGFYALEFLLFDEAFSQEDTADYRCDLVRAIAQEIHRNANGIAIDWKTYQDALRTPAQDGLYKTDEEALREVFKALLTGLQFTSDARLGRPLGTFDRPRPRRAEARRSERSLRHVDQSLASTYALALILSEDQPMIRKSLVLAFDRALELARDLDDPSFAGVADPAGRFRVEVLQSAVDRIREIATLELAPALGVSAGFNALDGD